MNVSAIDLNAVSQVQPPRHHSHAAMSAAAKLLGMDPSDIRAALRQGQSLADLAKAKGINQDDLVAAMATAIQKDNPSLSADQAKQIATDMATRVPPQQPAQGDANSAAVQGAGGGHHHHHHGGGDLMNAVSQLLGVSTDDIGSALKSGQSLVDLAKSKGVSQDKLVQTLATAFQADNPNLSADQATQIATEFATATPSASSYLSVQA